MTGVELMTKNVQGAGIKGGEPNFAQDVENRGFVPALLAFSAALLGLGLALAMARSGWTLGASLLALGALVILLLSSTDADRVRVEVGFIGAVVCFGLAVLEHLNALIVDREKSSTTRVPPGALPRL